MITYLAIVATLACIASVLRLLIAYRDYQRRWNYVDQAIVRTRRTQ